MGQKKEESSSELRLVFVGGRTKEALFHKLCGQSKRWEKHAAYQDIHYLTVDHQGVEITIEVTDPGLGKTGGREMAIRDADMALLFYSHYDQPTFETISSLPAVFALRKKPCSIRLISDTDEMEMEETATSSSESVSEGYESDLERSGSRLRRRESMERMRERQENESVTTTKGEDLSSQLGDFCRFLHLSVSEWEDPMKSLLEMVEETLERRKKSKTRRRFSFSKESKNSFRANSASSTDGEKKDREKKEKVQSKVCSIQ
ncbi:hypothetical protein PFISCL1PPCAC_24416 [Pristionchus fissidentatus]|uniref:Uncharacterized protein n=1 Tax=Pristionchus fissidentatus TaxID=1538716 RepID=A0AAV5WQZ8_9BILA|nr:hypothetical protein PFISCL1PPCAC_24416 [Pristionchus fissidentatus]